MLDEHRRVNAVPDPDGDYMVTIILNEQTGRTSTMHKGSQEECENYVQEYNKLYDACFRRIHHPHPPN